MNKMLVRLVSAFIFLTAIFAHAVNKDVLTAIYFLLMALYLIRVSETL